MEFIMEYWWLWIIIVLFLIFMFAIFPNILVSMVMFRKLLVRIDKLHWSRDCSIDDDEEQIRMYKLGEKWYNEKVTKKIDVDIMSEGFHLFGEYLDFGFNKAAIIIPGRMEGCHYSYFFSEPYRLSGYNVLVIDNRSHGLSDGKYNSLGLKEYPDLIAWSKFLHDEMHNESIILHGICIGSAGALYALIDPKCPDYIEGMVADGMYVNFIESVKNHIIERKRKVYPTINYFNAYLKLRLGVDVVKDGPINHIAELKKPILFLYSKEDIYSVPEKGQLLYDTCQSKKKIVWFDKGAHSRLRINATEKYDQTVKSFLEENFK